MVFIERLKYMWFHTVGVLLHLILTCLVSILLTVFSVWRPLFLTYRWFQTAIINSASENRPAFTTPVATVSLEL